MEGLAVIVALGAMVVAVVAMALALQSTRRGPDMSPAGARVIDLERRHAQMAQRLEIVEAEVDASGSGDAGTASAYRAGAPGTSAISRIGLVRFDAFADTGGAQSFSLALLDDDGDGIVLTSLHSRPTTRVYVKSIRRGVADAPLSGEEERALREAGITP